MVAALPQATLGKLIAAGFTADMISHAPEAARKLGEELGKPESDRDNDAITTAAAAPSDTTPPVLSTATVNGATLTLTYDEALDTGSTPATVAASDCRLTERPEQRVVRPD